MRSCVGVLSSSPIITHPFGLRNVAPDLSGSTGVDSCRCDIGGLAGGSLGGAGLVVVTRREAPRPMVPDTNLFGILAPSLSSVVFSFACMSRSIFVAFFTTPL